MKRKTLTNKYEGMGFAEALIALMVAGLVAIVLMRISSSTLRELAQLDIQDAIAQQAVSASVDLQRIAIADMTKEEAEKEFSDLIPDQNPEPTYCYGISEDGERIIKTFTCGDRDSYTVIPNSDYFRIFRVKSTTPQKAVIEIITGVVDMAGVNTSSTDIKDYSYLVTIVR